MLVQMMVTLIGGDMELIEQALADLDIEDAAQSQEVTEDGEKEILMTLRSTSPRTCRTVKFSSRRKK